MRLYLVRHGEAMPGADDPTRLLTPRGRADVERLAAAAVARGVTVAEIRHSGLARARQTAEILADVLRPPGGAEATAGLAPDDDPDIVAAEIEGARAPVLLVGHLPHLGRLTALLTRDRARVELRPASMLALTPGQGTWEVAWLIDRAATS